MVEPELLGVAAETADREIDADHAGFLGAGEQPGIGAAGAADCDGLRVLEVIGLIPDRGTRLGEKSSFEMGRGVGQ
jgi:hypothetical protein